MKKLVRSKQQVTHALKNNWVSSKQTEQKYRIKVKIDLFKMKGLKNFNWIFKVKNFYKIEKRKKINNFIVAIKLKEFTEY